MLDGKDEADQLPLIYFKRTMLWCHYPTEEGHEMLALQKDNSKPIGAHITFDDEGLRKVWHREDMHRGDGYLEGSERGPDLFCPCEALLAGKGYQGCNNYVEILAELMVVPSQAAECPYRTR